MDDGNINVPVQVWTGCMIDKQVSDHLGLRERRIIQSSDEDGILISRSVFMSLLPKGHLDSNAAVFRWEHEP